MLISDGFELGMHALKCTKCLRGNRIWNVHKNIPKLEIRLKVRMLDNQIEQKEGKKSFLNPGGRHKMLEVSRLERVICSV